MLGAGTVRRLETRRVGQSVRMSASNGGDKVAERRTAVGGGRAARLKQIRASRRSESPSPAVLLVDDHVHLPGSVFCDAPVRHQQTDTCGEGRDAKRRQHTCPLNTRSRTWPAVRLLHGDADRRRSDGLGKRRGKRIPKALRGISAAGGLITHEPLLKKTHKRSLNILLCDKQLSSIYTAEDTAPPPPRSADECRPQGSAGAPASEYLHHIFECTSPLHILRCFGYERRLEK